ncbi:MAG: hypothetical protein CVU63_15695 [Deltaproteobacteria bacterium HGW-Deltaproteobacteria-20]|nr:MAG: hypothetical protein CVU63_15695 [Deltaproteobacteria bacterium HGW-Deltaproteobacteria-20]
MRRADTRPSRPPRPGRPRAGAPQPPAPGASARGDQRPVRIVAAHAPREGPHVGFALHIVGVALDHRPGGVAHGGDQLASEADRNFGLAAFRIEPRRDDARLAHANKPRLDGVAGLVARRDRVGESLIHVGRKKLPQRFEIAVLERHQDHLERLPGAADELGRQERGLGAAHGEICAALLPHVMEANIRTLRHVAPEHPALARYDEVGRLLTGREDARSEDGLEFAWSLCQDLGIRGLGELGLTGGVMEDMVEKASRASSMHGNPIVLDRDELLGILRRAMGGFSL